MTKLSLTVGVREIAEGQRRFLLQVDLSSLGELPAGLTLRASHFLEVVRLPADIEAIPARFFENCPKLWSINVEECKRLKEVGWNAVFGCCALTMLTLPASCVKVDVQGSFLLDMVLVGSGLEEVNIRWSSRMRKLVLPARARPVLHAKHNVSLRRLTLARSVLKDCESWARGVVVEEARVPSVCGREHDGLAASLMLTRVFGELASWGRRQGRPLLPL
jgi:hypothetical protein